MSNPKATPLEGYDTSELQRIGTAQVQMHAQLARLQASQVSLWRAAYDAGVGLRQMLAYAVAHDVRPRYAPAPSEDEAEGAIIVASAEPLLALAAVERIDLLLRLAGGPLHISDGVWQETVLRGVDDDEITAKLLHTLIHADKLRHYAIKITPTSPHLAPAEEESLALAVQLNADFIIADDPVLRLAAQTLGLKVRSSLAMLRESVRRCLLPVAQARSLAFRMATRTTWLDTNLVEAMWDEQR